MDTEFAASIGLTRQGFETGTVEADELELAKSGRLGLEAGEIRLESKGAYILPLASRVANLDFILGMDLFAEVPFTVDFTSRKIELGLRPGHTVPFASSEDLRPTVRMDILGDTFVGILDTGSSKGLSVPLRWAESRSSDLNVGLGAGGERTILGDGKLRFHKFELDQITLEGIVLDRVPAEAVAAEKGSASDQTTNWASVGNRILERLGSLGIDCVSRTVTLGR